MELGYIYAAAIAAGPASAAVWVSVRSGGKIKKVHDEIRTNNGKRAGEYLELISSEQEFMARQLVGSAGRQLSLDNTMQRHILDDEERFATIMQKLNHIDPDKT